MEKGDEVFGISDEMAFVFTTKCFRASKIFLARQSSYTFVLMYSNRSVDCSVLACFVLF